MGNIKKFEEFNSVNEGLISWASKTFKPGELDYVIIGIIKEIKNNFNISKLSYIEPNYEYRNTGEQNNYIYTIQKKIGSEVNTDTINVHPDHLLINDDDVTKYINKNYISDLWDFFTTKYKNLKLETDNENEKNKLGKLRNKYDRFMYYNEEDEEELG